MAVTKIKQLSNENDSDKNGWLLFLHLQDKNKNRYIPPAPSPDEPFELEINTEVPWCSSHDELLQRGIIVINRFDEKVLGFIWQDHEKGNPKEDFVRFGKSGWSIANKDNKISGDPTVGGSINLEFDKKGNIIAVKVHEKDDLSAVRAGEESEIPAEGASR